MKLIRKIALYTLFFLISSEASMLVFSAPSRRLCNISWVLYEMFICYSVLLMMIIAERITLDHKNTNICLNSINMNALFTFVGCNLLCGLINITTYTLYFTFSQGLVILYFYCLIPSLVFGWCYEKGVKLAF